VTSTRRADADEQEPGGAEITGVLDAIDVPVLVTGRDCRLARFNGAAADILGITRSDVGRLPHEIAALAGVDGIDDACAEVIAGEAPCRRDIRHDDRRFILRLAAYSARDDRVGGAVLTFTNVTAFRASIEQAIYEREYTKAILNTVADPLVVLDAALRVQTGNRAFYAMFGASREEAQGALLRDSGDEAWRSHELWASLGATAAAEFRPVEIEGHFRGVGARRTVVLDARRLDRDGAATVLMTFHDVTDRKRAEDGLRRGQDELRDFVENASVGMHWLGPDGVILWANRTELDSLGYTRDEFVGRHIAEFHVDAPVIEDMLARLAAGETLHDRAARLRAKDGGVRDVLINSNVLWEGGKFVHTRSFTRDVTERNRAEAALRESERRFREMIDALPAAVYTTDAEGQLTHFNPACVELAGRTPVLEEDRWCVTWKLYRPDGTPISHAECPMAVSLREGRPLRGAEAVAERPDGTRVWFTPFPAPLRDADGRVVGGINMLVDITEQKRAERALRESESRFRALFESMDEGYCVIEVIFDEHDEPVDFLFLETNPAFEKQTGIAEAKGRRMREIAPDHEQEWFDIYGTIARTGQTIRFENPAAALGRHYDVCAFRVGAPELRRVGVVFNDITARKKAEQLIRQNQAKLIEADRRKDEFLATLAHELRNPLAPIRNSLHVLRRANASNPDARRMQEIMERQVAHMVRLVDDLLELSRISRGQIQLKKERVALAAIVEHAVESSRPFVERHRHQLAISLPAEPMFVEGDMVRLSQVFANLLNNAAKYTEDGGRIALSARCEGGAVVVSIRDTGIGIPSDMLSRVFEMFTQVDSVLRRTQDGLGIGLSLVRSLVEMHGGSAEARSDGLGHGSEFTVRLPLATTQRSEAAPEDGRARSEPSPALRVLVVDDNRDAADSLRIFLELLSADVTVAYDGESALEAIRLCRPSIVVLDLGMPGLDGYTVAERVRADPLLRHVTLIALTGWGQEENRRRTREAGFDHHLVKPVDLDRLQALLVSSEQRSAGDDAQPVRAD
jgi:PAS domain S-box-containing protein